MFTFIPVASNVKDGREIPPDAKDVKCPVQTGSNQAYHVML